MNQPIGSTCDDTPVNSYKQKEDWEKEFISKFHKDGKYPLEELEFISSLIEETEKEAYEKGKGAGYEHGMDMGAAMKEEDIREIKKEAQSEMREKYILEENRGLNEDYRLGWNNYREALRKKLN